MYNDLGFDPDSSVQDADIEMAELAIAGHESAARAARGICDHGWTQEHRDGSVDCKDCGAHFRNAAAWETAREIAMES